MQIVPGVEYCEDTRQVKVQGRALEPSIRLFSQLLNVLRYPEKAPKDGEAYYMYRDLPPLRGSWARFDVTVIPPWKVGDELAKTKGHYHNSPLGKPPYPEIYQVHAGEALYILQKPGEIASKIVDFVVIRATPGDVVVIPPGYGHVTVNVGEETLVMSNVIYRGVKSNYGPFERLRGAAYHFTTSGFLKNDRYSEVPEIRFEKEWKRSEAIVLELVKEEHSFIWLRDTDKACEMRFLGADCGDK
ncbi:MAG TPA: glucose-6-phosphate isomerase [Candidatus Korarchaeota archaeon]|nr:glucose-6-phosphate isomerase [Candidatus Korarchaeota archaeon]